MGERRPLIAGLKGTSEVNALEQKFVFGAKAEAKTDVPQTAEAEGPTRPTKRQKALGRAPFTTRIRADFAAALKRASLERQLNGQFPNTLQDILEEALDPWLHTRGYVNGEPR